MAESVNTKLKRVRPPRVHITYDVQIGDAIKLMELPFVVGVLADLSGQPEQELPELANRAFTEVDRDKFNTFMKALKPRLDFWVQNKLTDEAEKLAIELFFEKLEDFEPEPVARQIPPLRELLETRDRLKGLLSRMKGDLPKTLQPLLDNKELMEKLTK